jgi:hypothetical protein
MRRSASSIGFTTALLLLALQGCSLSVVALRTVGPLFDNTVSALMRETDLRLAEPALAANLKLLEGVLATDPANVKDLQLAVMGFTSYALIYASDEPDRALDFYSRAQAYGVRGLQLRGVPAGVFTAEAASMSAALLKLGKADVPLVFWTADAWGSMVSLQMNDPAAVASLPTVAAMMEWVRDTDPGYYFGGAYLYFGVYYGSIPPAFGGKPEMSRESFEQAIALGGGKFLMTYVFYARTYAVEIQDPDLFRELLQHVIDAPANVLPEQGLANAAAKQRATRLLAGLETYF